MFSFDQYTLKFKNIAYKSERLSEHHIAGCIATSDGQKRNGLFECVAPKQTLSKIISETQPKNWRCYSTTNMHSFDNIMVDYRETDLIRLRLLYNKLSSYQFQRSRIIRNTELYLEEIHLAIRNNEYRM